MMHWSWKIFKQQCTPSEVPPMEGVDIIWNTGNEKEDIARATIMAHAFGITELNVAPALKATGRHMTRTEI
jgi:glutamate mutase epsilon subunit